MSLAMKSVSWAIMLGLATACSPPPPKIYETTVALPNPPAASAVAHLEPSEACAALAGDPLEPGANGRGADIDQIDFRAALKYCDAAVANGRGTQTDYYNRARAVQAGMAKASDADSAKWIEDAFAAYELAADKGHPYASMLLAELRRSDQPNRPKDIELSARLRNAAFAKLEDKSTWWPDTKLFIGLAKLRDENFRFMTLASNDEASSAESHIANAVRGGMARYVMREYDRLRCSKFDAPQPGVPLSEVCEMLLKTMAENGVVAAAVDLAIREYNSGVRAAQRHGVRHNDAGNGYSRGKFWAERALEGKIDADPRSLEIAREIRDTVTEVKARIANQDRAVMAVVDFFGRAFSSPSRSNSASSGYEMDLSHITDPHKNGTCLGAGLAGDGMELFASGC